MYNQDKINLLKEKIGNLSRVKLANLPTPLMELPRFSKALGGPTIYMKRDDLTGGLSFGGNKTRMLEFRLAPAVEQKADVVVYGAAIQSNHARQVSVAARRLGMDARIILRKTPHDKKEPLVAQGNLLIDLIASAQIKIVDISQPEQINLVHQETEKLKKEGRNPYETGVHDVDLSAVAYVSCSIEITEQLKEANFMPTHLYVASEGATQAGLSLFAKYAETDYSVVGINMADWIPSVKEKMSIIANAAAKKLEIDCTLSLEEIINDEENYIGEGYSIPTQESLEAIKLLASTEGILADPIYVGRGLAGLIDHIRTGKLSQQDRIIFIHTGGVPTLFTFAHLFNFEEQLKSQEE